MKRSPTNCPLTLPFLFTDFTTWYSFKYTALILPKILLTWLRFRIFVMVVELFFFVWCVTVSPQNSWRFHACFLKIYGFLCLHTREWLRELVVFGGFPRDEVFCFFERIILILMFWLSLSRVKHLDICKYDWFKSFAPCLPKVWCGICYYHHIYKPLQTTIDWSSDSSEP